MKCSTALLIACALGASCSTMFGQTLQTLAPFNGSDGDLPYGGLIADSSGNLYGTTYYGGAYGYGTIFELDGATHTIAPLFSFDATDGANPQAGLVADASGNFYGTTVGGGPNHAGSVFEFSPATRTLTTLAFFDPATTGNIVTAGLTKDANGNFYGAASSGGTNGGGTVFKIDGATHALTVLASFGTVNGQEPVSPSAPVLDAAGNLYGDTANSIYRISAVNHNLTTVAATTGTATLPQPLIVGANGSFYGTTSNTVFRFDSTNETVTTLVTFNGPNGEDCAAGLVADANGDVYGTTYGGGATYSPGNPGLGTVFKLDPATDVLSTLASFEGGTYEAGPFASLLIDSAGNLYGTTTGGDMRAYGLGTVFEVTVPEPLSMALLTIAILGICLRRPRRAR